MLGLNHEITNADRRYRPPASGNTSRQLEVDGLVWAPGGQRWIYELTLTGALDLACAPRLDAILREAVAGGAGDIHLDMAGIGFLDSAGLHVLVEIQSLLSELHGRLFLREPSWSVRRLVCLADLCALLKLGSGTDPCRHNDAPQASGGSRYPAAGSIEADQPLRITGVHVTGVHTPNIRAAGVPRGGASVADVQLTGVHAA